MSKRLIEVIRSMDFSVDEKTRIVARVNDPESIQYKILSTKLTAVRSQDFWRIAHRKFKITGFREGFPKAREMILERALRLFKEPDAIEDTRLWVVYRASFEEYLRDLGQLDSLLASEVLPEGDTNLTERVFSSISKAAPAYGVTEQQAIDLYDSWCFQRVPDIKQMLNQPIDADVVRKLITREADSIRRNLEKASADLGEKLSHSAASLKQDIAKVAEDLHSLETQLNANISTVRTEASNQIAAIASANADFVRDALKKAVVRSPTKEKPAASSDELIELQKRIHDLSKKISEIERKQVQPVIQASPTAAVEVGKNTLPATILTEYQAHLKIQMGDQWNESIFALFLSCIISTPILITDDTRPFDFLFSKLGNTFVQQLGVNPMWTNAEPWSAQYRFISEKSERPRILVLKDFDCALQELYLIPKLLEWGSNDASKKNRIILSLSEPKFDFVSKRTLELGIPIQFTNDAFIDMRSIAGEVGTGRLTSLVADTDLAKVFENVGSTDPRFESNLRTLLENDGLSIPSSVAGTFTKLVAALSRFFHPDLAPRIAIQILVHPWICKVRGAHAGRMLDERMRVIFGV